MPSIANAWAGGLAKGNCESPRQHCRRLCQLGWLVQTKLQQCGTAKTVNKTVQLA